MKIKDKTILITGADGGIGKTISTMLVDAGARLIAVGHAEQGLAALVDSLPGDHVYVTADLSKPEGIQAVVDEVPGQQLIDGPLPRGIETGIEPLGGQR
ncbi:MAG: SDR family NAD(P)-dependent oxidoreductase [Gammaproteobacteria bacterium]|nr:SDR family NAD(P)-dependent oxidoreductase [Gammaproteobacteria bacterium]